MFWWSKWRRRCEALEAREAARSALSVTAARSRRDRWRLAIADRAGRELFVLAIDLSFETRAEALGWARERLGHVRFLIPE